MQHGREGPLPAFLFENARGVLVGLPRVDHQRQLRSAWRRTRVEIVTMWPIPAASARATMASSSAAKSGKSRWQWLSTSMRKSPATVGEDQRHIVSGHLNRLVQAESGGFTNAFKIGNITQAPRWIARL